MMMIREQPCRTHLSLGWTPKSPLYVLQLPLIDGGWIRQEEYEEMAVGK